MLNMDSKRIRILSIVVILCVVISGLLIGAAQLFQTQTEQPLYNADKKITSGETEVVTQESVSYIPGTATSVYSVAPQSAEEVGKWWESFIRIAKYRLDLPIDISPIANDVKQITLVQIPNEESYREEVGVLVEVKDGVDANNTMEYLATMTPDPNASAVFAYDNVVTITSPSLIETVDKVMNNEADNIASNEKFMEDTAGAKDSIFWYDLSGFMDSISSEAMLEKHPEAVKNISQKLMGFKDNTRWVGTSENFGESWVGKFPSGGYDPELQDMTAYENAVMEEFDYSGEMGDGKFDENRPVIEDEDKPADFNKPSEGEEEPYPTENEPEEKPAEGTEPDEGNAAPAEDEPVEGHNDYDVGEFVAGPSLAALDAVSVRSNTEPPAQVVPEESEEQPENAEDEKKNDEPVTLGAVVDWTTGETIQPAQTEELDYFDTVIMFSPAALTNALTSSGIYSTNIHSHTLRIKDGTMEVSTAYTSPELKNEHILDLYDKAEANKDNLVSDRKPMEESTPKAEDAE